MSRQLPNSVSRTMQALADGLFAILGDRLVGVYLGGSMAMGDFCEPSSDLDFMAVTRGPLSMEDLLAVELLHKDLLRRYPYAARLVGDYPEQELLIPEGTAAPVPGCERGVFWPKVGEVVLSAESIYIMRKYGKTFFGPQPQYVLPAVSDQQVRDALYDMLTQCPPYSDGPLDAASAVLNLVRSACTLSTGEIVTKSDGAQWALEHLDPRWHAAINAALAIRCGNGTREDEAVLQQALPDLDLYIRSEYCGQRA